METAVVLTKNAVSNPSLAGAHQAREQQAFDRFGGAWRKLTPQARALMFVLLATFGLALKGIWARLAYADGASVQSVLFYRAALSLPLIVACGRLFSSKKLDATRWRTSHLVLGVLMGAFFSVGMFCDFQSIFYLGAGVSRVVLFGYPLVVMVFDAAVRRSFPSKRRLLGFFVAWVGLTLVCGALDQWASPGQGGFTMSELSWGLASLVFYASYVYFSGRLSPKMGASRLSLLSNLSTSVLVVSVLLVRGAGAFPDVSVPALCWIAAMVVVSTVVPYFLMMEGISRLGATQASLTSMVGPVLTVFAGALVLGEALSSSQLLGVVFTLCGVYFVQQKTKRAKS